ncbi:hypothetical protein [Pantanalinema sp. GBBB05]|uniref:hypothetical protein n=1 Tax=Pantanalinema sp. GBBB05 TaxID=2604139 RepID=UPI001E0D65A1|nr:hypothetical protein [Pantanalinema sp. GBBB05]
MANINERDYNREHERRLSGQVTGSQDVHPDRGATARQAAYHNGYVQGRDNGYVRGRDYERQYDRDLETRDNENAGRGLLLGILLTALVAATAGAVFLLNQRERTAPSSPAIVVPRISPNANQQQQPQVRERIIERDRVVPVPQTSAPAPRVNITVPSANQSAPSSQAPATQAPAAPAPTQGANDNGSVTDNSTDSTQTTPFNPSAPDTTNTQSGTGTESR